MGRTFLLRLFGLPLVLPQIVAVLALASLYGNQGYVTLSLQKIGVDMPSIYGLTGILVAHVFFNLPLIVRIVLGALGAMPPEYDRLAHQLSLGAWARVIHIYWPFMRGSLFNAAALVFMLCVTSFTVVLTLGGGPRATTIEVAIYQALTFDFDVARAVVLTALQLLLTSISVGIFAFCGGELQSGLSLNTQRPMVERKSVWVRVLSVGAIMVCGVFIAAPFVAIVSKGLAADLIKLLGQETVRHAILTSFTLGFCAASLCVVLCLALCEGAVQAGARRRWLYAHASSLILVVPPIVLAAGWFLLLRPWVNIYAAAPYLVVVINAAMALPFAMRFLLPARQIAHDRQSRLCAQLGIVGFNKWRHILLPVLRGPMLIAFAFAFALSLGDLGVIALFGSEKVQTLPHLILQRMGSYRTNDAAGLAFILCCLTMALMMFVDRRSASTKAGDSS
ncbi:MAG: ABC transporter permease subunit [Ahrensia sp.]|nr:ABC transporter permease subunit [Ahrensia sp.]